MERRIKQVPLQKMQAPKLTKVAAYARVSSGKDAMLHSLSAQVSYYNELIQRHPGWVFCGVYADEALTGTKADRKNFTRLLEDCKAGKVDMIVTKSISRFARNTLTLLETVRMLKDIGVDVYFEEQNIHSMSGDGELMLTILASYAQEESLSASENQKWRVKANFQAGKPWNCRMLGYRYDKGKYVMIPEEAEIVREIFRMYLGGYGVPAIIQSLKEQGAETEMGNQWSRTSITKILRNYTYTGNLLLQRVYRENHLTKKTLVNHGELPQYHATDTHEPIIDIGTYNSVQLEMHRRAQKYGKQQTSEKYPFSGMISCANCGKHYRRKVTATGPVWICSTYNTHGKAVCPSKAIPESTLMEIAATVSVTSEITAVTAHNNNTLEFTLADGTVTVKQWQERSRAAITVAAQMSESYRKSLIGTQQAVLFEEEEGGFFTGHAPNYVKIYAHGENLHNQVRNVTVTALHADGVLGKIDG